MQKILALLPPNIFWHGAKELDAAVVRVLTERFIYGPSRITGGEIARRLGTNDRTIRGSIKRLREAGHNISASLAPPRGYRLENYDGEDVE